MEPNSIDVDASITVPPDSWLAWRLVQLDWLEDIARELANIRIVLEKMEARDAK